MWNDQNNGGGGFFNSPNNYPAQVTPARNNKSGKKNSKIAQLVIKQILDSSEDGIKCWGSEIQIACVVAKIKDIKIQSTKIVYVIEDITGQMQAMRWIDQESANYGEVNEPNIMVNTYVQLFGNLKHNLGKKVLVIYKIFNITDVNAITFHYLQCISNKIYLENKFKNKKTNGDANVNANNSTMPVNSMMSMNMGGAPAGFNPRQLMVYNSIKAADVDQGSNKFDMMNKLKDKMSKMEFEKILEWLCGEGHIYSTIDDDHFRITDASI